MSVGSGRCVFYAVVFGLVLVFLDTRTGTCCTLTQPHSLPIEKTAANMWDVLFSPPDAALEGSSMGYLSLPDSPEPAAFSGVVRVSDVRASHGGSAVISRRKRNILFSSGVKLCAQETTDQVLAHHLSYFHLRGKISGRHKDFDSVRLSSRCPQSASRVVCSRPEC